MTEGKQQARLDVARHAARLFLKHGVAGTSSDDIAAAAGISRRTFWRYFRTKESAIEPIFDSACFRFVSQMDRWQLDQPIEAFIDEYFALEKRPKADVDDDVLCALLLSKLPMEPGLQEAWLMANHKVQTELQVVVADRARRHRDDFEVMLCAATMIAAIRVVDEYITDQVLNRKQAMTTPETNRFLAQSLRTASTLPICDPIPP